MEKLADFLKRIFYVMFIAFPVTTALIMSLRVFINALKGENIITDYWFVDMGFHNPVISTVFTIAIWAVLILVVFKFCRILFSKNKVIAPAAALLCALLPRIFLFAVFRSSMIPYSDGKYAWEGAMGVAPQRLALKVIQNGWNNFTGLLKFVIDNFNMEYTTVMLFIFIADALIALVVFLIANEIFHNVSVSFVASVLYALNPSLITRNFYLSPDIISQLGVAVAVLLLIKMFKETDTGSILMLALAAGLSAGTANAFKSVSAVLVVAVLIVTLIKYMGRKTQAKQIKAFIMALAVFTVLALGINKVGLKISSEIIGIECKDLNTWHFINVGLNPEGGGSVAHWNGHYYSGLIQAGTDPVEARQMFFVKIAEDWRTTQTTVPQFLKTKISTVWGDAIQNFSKQMLYSLDTENFSYIQQKMCSLMIYTVPSCCQTWYVLTMLSAVIGAVYMLVKYIKNEGALLVCLHTFGFSLMLLISEVQSRYKSNIMHLIVILAAVGIWRIYSTVTKEKTTVVEIEKEKVRSH